MCRDDFTKFQSFKLDKLTRIRIEFKTRQILISAFKKKKKKKKNVALPSYG